MDKRQKILIVDDAEFNRVILKEILGETYNYLEAENGNQAIQIVEENPEIDLMLLDINMPQMNGFGVLEWMNRFQWIDETPVIMISSEESVDTMRKAYEMGITDYITRPFDSVIVKKRVQNTLALYENQKRLVNVVVDQVYEKEENNNIMIGILSNVLGFRNSESSEHILHIKTATEMMLRKLVKVTDAYPLTEADIALITTASSLHDIGKVGIPEEILNKPGRLTDEEFKIMKTHSEIGASLIRDMRFPKDKPLVHTAWEICRWHHERWDGKGYPDGLKGEEIPISAQAVSLADVYDALTSERCYKAAYSHEKAIEMILAGQCGAFNPLLLECLLDISGALKREMSLKSHSHRYDGTNMVNIANRFHDFELESSEKIVQQLEYERQSLAFLAENSDNIIFTYTASPPILNMNKAGTKRSGITEPILSPLSNDALGGLIEKGSLNRLTKKIREATREMPHVVSDIRFLDGRTPERYRCDCKVIWASEENNEYTGVVGKLTDIDADYSVVSDAKDIAIKHGRSAAFSNFYDRFKAQGFTVSGEEAWVLLQYLQITFDLVRYVNPITRKMIHVEKDGRVWETEFDCYAVWNCNEGCSNCISASCVRTKERKMKIEAADNEAFQIVSMYVEIEGKPCCLELVVKIDDTFVPQGYSKEEVLSSVRIHKENMYLDRVTGIYNKFYYTEKLCRMEAVAAVAMADIKDFKRINENFGHQTGDDVLRRVAGVIHDAVGENGDALRYSGDNFVMVFSDISNDKFEGILEDIRKNVESLVFMELPGVKLELNVSGVCRPGKVDELLDQVRI